MAHTRQTAPRQRIVQSRTKVVEHVEEHVIEDAVVFIKNINPHEILVMRKPDKEGKGGKTMQFKGTKLITNNEEEIEFLTRLAEAGSHGILIQEAPKPEPIVAEIPPVPPVPPAPVVTEEPAADQEQPPVTEPQETDPKSDIIA